MEIDYAEIDWYRPDRQQDFDMQVPDDAKAWKTIKYKTVRAVETQTGAEIDICKLAIVFDYLVALAESGNMTVKLIPVKGEASIFGAIPGRINME